MCVSVYVCVCVCVFVCVWKVWKSTHVEPDTLSLKTHPQ